MAKRDTQLEQMEAYLEKIEAMDLEANPEQKSLRWCTRSLKKRPR
jgi:hypothetical protein